MDRIASRLLGTAASVALLLALAPGSATAQMMDDSRPPVEIDLRGGLVACLTDTQFSSPPSPDSSRSSRS